MNEALLGFIYCFKNIKKAFSSDHNYLVMNTDCEKLSTGYPMKITYEPQYENLLRALTVEGQDGLEFALSWLDNLDLDSIDGSLHRLLPIFYKKLNQYNLSGIPIKELGRLKGIYRYYFYKNNLIINESSKIFHALVEAKIEFMLLKGISLILGGYYQDYALRPIDDIDILVDKKNEKEVLVFLKRFGWQKLDTIQQQSHFINKDYKYKINLHRYSLTQHCSNFTDEDFWKYAEAKTFNDNTLRFPSPTDQVWHNCFHSIGYYAGPTILAVIDVINILKISQDTIDWERLIATLKKWEQTYSILNTFLYVDSIVQNLVPYWVIKNLSEVKVSKKEKILFNSFMQEQKGIIKYWKLHFHNNPDKGLIYNMVTFPKYFKSLCGLNNFQFFKLINKRLYKAAIKRIRNFTRNL
jgi:hypothetical protein